MRRVARCACGGLILLLGVLLAPLGAQEEKESWQFVDGQKLTLEGRGFDDVATPYDRLPAKAEAMVPKPVWGLSRHSAGISLRFRAATTALRVRYTLRSEQLAMTHMPATGVSGLDLYARDADGQWRWVAVGRPQGLKNDIKLVTGLDPTEREYRLYFPLYNGVTELEVGVPQGARIAAAAVDERPAIVFYGTSITQGGCASRPGMAHVAMLGRRLDHPVINLGFSGRGRMELALADLVAEVDAAIYVLDTVPNMDAKLIDERAVAFVKRLRAKRPTTPILLVEDRSYQDGTFRPARAAENASRRAAWARAWTKLQEEGVAHLHQLRGDVLLGDDGEGTVDASHPTDLGFFRQAEAFEAVLRPILRAPR